MHMATHAVGKITLFFCAGAIYTAAKKTKVSELDGLAKVMPITFIAYTVAALSIIGPAAYGGGLGVNGFCLMVHYRPNIFGWPSLSLLVLY